MNKLLLTVSLLLFAGMLTLSAQTLPAWIKAAETAYDRGDYYSAYKYYGVAVEYDSTRFDLWYRYGASAQGFTAYRLAERIYQRIIFSDYRDSFPDLYLRMAQVKERMGDYANAAGLYQYYLDNQPNASPEERQRASWGVENCQWAAREASKSYQTVVQHYPGEVNSPYSDFGLIKRGVDSVYYSSMRFPFRRDTIIPARSFSKIILKVGEASAKPLSDDINIPGRHAANLVFNSAGTRVYYTLCDFVDQTEVRCDLFASVVAPNGKWGPPVPQAVNVPGYSVTQPNLGLDPRTGQEYLYFASDCPGTLGGLDIWRATVAPDGALGAPQNLGESINTPADEASPFFHAPTQTLYFSSNGRYTLGGYDIYRSSYTGSGWAEPTNLGLPINSSYNDLYYSIMPAEEKAYFASNRPDTAAIFWDEFKEACCFDIYSVDNKLEVRLLALTFDKSNGNPLEGATVELYEITPDGPILVASRYNPDANNFPFALEPAKRYELRATRPGFSPARAQIDLTDPALAGLTDIEQKLYLEPGLELQAFTFRSLDNSPLNGATVELWEIDDQGVRTRLVDSLRHDQTHEFNFPLEYGKRYLIYAERDGYGPASDTLDLRNVTLVEGGSIRRDLYLGQLLEIYTYDASTGAELNGVEIELLRPATPQNELRASQFNPDGNRFDFTIDLNQPYLYIAKRRGYETLNDTLKFTPQDLIDGGGKLVFELRLTPIDLTKFLPLQLFFDNDYPDPRTYTTTTNANYYDTNLAYYARKQEFITNFVEGMSQEEAFRTRRGFNDFFEREVKSRRFDLDLFAERLLAYLQDGNAFTLTLRGFASPRATPEYNRRLSMRRLASVRNYFERFQDGAFLPFLRDGRLRFQTEALGESQASRLVSDRLDNPRESVFGLAASAERRVDIVSVTAQQ